MDPRTIFNAIEKLVQIYPSLAKDLMKIAEDPIIATRLEEVAFEKGYPCGYNVAKQAAEHTIEFFVNY